MSEDYVLDLRTARKLELLLKYDESYTMPSGLTREERRAWISSRVPSPFYYTIEIESCLDFDDSEYRKTTLNPINIHSLGDIIDTLNSYWDYEGEDILNGPILEWMLKTHQSGIIDQVGCFDTLKILEDDSTVSFESCRRRFTITMYKTPHMNDNDFYTPDYGTSINFTKLSASNLETISNHVKEEIEKIVNVDSINIIDEHSKRLTITINYTHKGNDNESN